ncbi:MAG TPA: 1-acyl-sn-glycerol-3-phosphate acyltransferase, partial [Polyangiaceae bacterium]|nr:1-acyl-sn-glycerol-3-phosphate acyltransferase [Polyangiaceae bacterium]
MGHEPKVVLQSRSERHDLLLEPEQRYPVTDLFEALHRVADRRRGRPVRVVDVARVRDGQRAPRARLVAAAHAGHAQRVARGDLQASAEALLGIRGAGAECASIRGVVTAPASRSTPAPLAVARTWLSTLLFWPYLLFSSALLFAGALALFLLTVPFDRRRAILHLYTCAWAYHYVKLLPLWKAQFEGLEHIRPGQTYMLVANHQSLGDILVLFGLFKHYKWVSKRAIFRTPFVGWNMWLNDYVALTRG